MVSSRVHSSDVYRLFLQAAMSRRIMSEAMAKALWKACTEAIARADPTKDIEFVDSANEWNLFLDKIKRMLDPLDLELVHARDENTEVLMYAITNTKADEVAQLASDYNPTEISFFKAIVEQIMLSPNNAYSVSSMAALREIKSVKPGTITKTDGETILRSFVVRRWLATSKRGRYSLGTRSVLELGSYLKNTYEESDLLECVSCMDLVTKGHMCPTPNCMATLHKHCFRSFRNKKMCPKCQQGWGDGSEDLLPVGEDAVREGQTEHRRVRRTSGGDGEDDEEEEQETQSQSQPSQSQRTQTQAKKSKSKKAPAKNVNGKSKKRATTPESDEEKDQLDDMYDDDDKDETTMDIDDLDQIRERSSGRRSRH